MPNKSDDPPTGISENAFGSFVEPVGGLHARLQDTDLG